MPTHHFPYDLSDDINEKKHNCKEGDCGGIICPDCNTVFYCHEDRHQCKICGGQMVFQVDVTVVEEKDTSKRFVN